MSDVLSPYLAATYYVPYSEYVDKPEYWAGLATQDISPPGSAQYYAGNTEWMTDTERRVYTAMQQRVMSGVVSRTPVTLTPEEQQVTLGLATDYVDRISNSDLNRVTRGLESSQTIKGTTPTPVTPTPVDPVVADPGSVVNYYYQTTNNYNQDPSQGPSQSDSFSWLFPMMMMMMLMNNLGGVQGQQPAKAPVVYETW